jgi:hypothetical protein
VLRLQPIVTCDVGALLDHRAVTGAAWLKIWRALASCEPGWSARIDIGDANRAGPAPGLDDVLSASIFIGIAGTDPAGVRAVIDALRAA